MTAGPESPSPPGRPPVRRWVKWVGGALILAVWLPFLAVGGSCGYLYWQTRRVENAAEKARAAIRVGSTLSEAIRTSAEPIGTHSLLSCYEANCLGPPAVLLVHRGPGWFTVLPDSQPGTSFKNADWAGSLAPLDEVSCPRVKVTFCGRPWITFFVDMDESRRVRIVGPLGVSAD